MIELPPELEEQAIFSRNVETEESGTVQSTDSEENLLKAMQDLIILRN